MCKLYKYTSKQFKSSTYICRWNCEGVKLSKLKLRKLVKTN